MVSVTTSVSPNMLSPFYKMMDAGAQTMLQQRRPRAVPMPAPDIHMICVVEAEFMDT
jgi:hypothetical protein